MGAAIRASCICLSSSASWRRSSSAIFRFSALAASFSSNLRRICPYTTVSNNTVSFTDQCRNRYYKGNVKAVKITRESTYASNEFVVCLLSCCDALGRTPLLLRVLLRQPLQQPYRQHKQREKHGAA